MQCREQMNEVLYNPFGIHETVGFATLYDNMFEKIIALICLNDNHWNASYLSNYYP